MHFSLNSRLPLCFAFLMATASLGIVMMVGVLLWSFYPLARISLAVALASYLFQFKSATFAVVWLFAVGSITPLVVATTFSSTVYENSQSHSTFTLTLSDDLDPNMISLLAKSSSDIIEPRELISGAKTYQTVIFSVLQGAMALVVIGLYAWRVATLKLLQISKVGWSFSRIMLNIIYISAICFVVSAFIVALGWGMKTDILCKTTIELCLVFYLGGKVFLYIFMCERLRSIRQGQVDRCADIIWQRCFFGILVIFGEIAIVCFYYPVESTLQGYCTIGLPTFITGPMLIFDVFCNLTVSIIFYRLSREQFNGIIDALIEPKIRRYFYCKMVNDQGQRGVIFGRPLSEMPMPSNANALMAFIIRKTLMVSILILASTIINLVLLFHFNGAEHGWMCFMFCSLDITWNVGCITWLIGMPTQEELYSSEEFANRRDVFEQENKNVTNALPYFSTTNGTTSHAPHQSTSIPLDTFRTSSISDGWNSSGRISQFSARRAQLSPPRDFHSSYLMSLDNADGATPSGSTPVAGQSSYSPWSQGRMLDDKIPYRRSSPTYQLNGSRASARSGASSSRTPDGLLPAR